LLNVFVQLANENGFKKYLRMAYLFIRIFRLLGRGRSETGSTIIAAITGLLYQPRMMMDDECGVICGMIVRGNRRAWRKPA
jgi:hypothetical protein